MTYGTEASDKYLGKTGRITSRQYMQWERFNDGAKGSDWQYTIKDFNDKNSPILWVEDMLWADDEVTMSAEGWAVLGKKGDRIRYIGDKRRLKECRSNLRGRAIGGASNARDRLTADADVLQRMWMMKAGMLANSLK